MFLLGTGNVKKAGKIGLIVVLCLYALMLLIVLACFFPVLYGLFQSLSSVG